MTRPVPAQSRSGHAGTTPTITRSAPMAVPDPPLDLGTFGAGLWTEVWTAGNGVYQATDKYIINRYCSLSERRKNLLEIVESDGWVTAGSQGQTVVHPAARMVDALEGKLQSLEDRLGLNPESRLRLGITAVEHQSALDAFLDKGRQDA
jgi:P27 family predicted phage terminase small subunit